MTFGDRLFSMGKYYTIYTLKDGTSDIVAALRDAVREALLITNFTFKSHLFCWVTPTG